ncbi:hypothetical protein GGS23DRAFT_607737 [Durotheca rogersii]|uniref:uncharacterized protein n=1 Tax=Durotheca rogersii TaxID=419775 RepID=UPI00221EC87E|nr:uncharacterized protein GGS23DRAFT_607737 [Durotheca rogersii]KAI5858215.1 hypothetical protein GGS23DRAFT_607737 [Durotheca rogersii]
MSSIPSTEPFKMRIPSPDPDLSGEALSKQVPDDPNRTGTIYADQFLAHKCPPDFDDLQRRQFFCVLDLRRLKYAADEIFVRKDWKLNIMNFAKEYEKSRGMIMLRYGLYEFKNVKPSEEVLKRWRAAHGLPDPETERTSAPSETPIPPSRRTAAPNTVSTKRKAEEDLAPKDNALMASTANQNKRRNVKEPAENALTGPAPFKKSKRKVEETDEPDENQPNKLQKPTPAKSKFESILDKASSGGTPTNGLKPADGEAGVDSNGSILSSHKIGSVPSTTTGIFSYLSESSANSSSNENDNAEDGDTDSESEEEADGQEPAPNKEPDVPAAATNTDTPTAQKPPALYSTSKPTEMPSLFGSLTKPKPADLTSKGGLFGRVQMGTNGQPLRATPDSEEQRSLSPVKQPEPAAEKEQKTPSTPMFGGQQPSTPAPSSSFTFSFGQQAPSTPNPPPASQGNSTLFGASSHGGNAAPSFSFTIGTTPVSGTPEPQSQHGDGEEGPQEQISLTDGGPGEEDEVMLHEVRAKAIKYVPVVKGSDEEEEKKSPWSTQGVGPLRVLKNKSTGTVRVLLRAEPRGHIAMNKALLSDVEYKAKDKTVNFVASSDSGLGLETWVLQVKKPDFARQLTEVLEANKSANKK